MKQNDNWKLADILHEFNREMNYAENAPSAPLERRALKMKYVEIIDKILSSQKAQSYKEGYEKGLKRGKEVAERYEAEMKAINLEIDL